MLNPFSATNSNHQQNLSLLKIYTSYRTLLSLALLATFFLSTENRLVGSLRPELFLYTASTYFIINLLTLAATIFKNKFFNNQFLFLNFFIDTVAIVLITDTSGGIGSGIEILLVIIVAASSIMLPARLSLLIAALASLMVIADTLSLIRADQLNRSSLVPSGSTGFILFITVYLISNLTKRIRSAQEVADQRALDVGKLQQLNRKIIQRMRTGIIVTNSSGYIKMANEAASELLGNRDLGKAYKNPKAIHLPTELIQQLSEWQQYPQYHTLPFRATETGPEIQASFSSLTDDDNHHDILIFLEDNRLVAQRAQQLKLASLGRLTASIAHEIRNPLSAASHAAQLLDESEKLDNADKRLSTIIQDHCRRMNQVIENVLQLSRRKAPNPEKICLNDYLQNFISEFDPGHTDYPYDIRINAADDRYYITVDTSQLNQILTNLAQNGLRYSFQHTGKASLLFDIHINPATQLPVLDVIDDGLGIDEIAKEQLFEPFYTTETKGTGLGLYISRELCQANEARLDYIRTTEGKSCFRISFPHPERRRSPEQE